ncbi:MCE family protein [Pseudonocardia alni]|jgi:phospholipid/cholesterol/gamma-HCH transport system substrate-binding protein|uniref:MCE family protein n=1 Tax=Pseudonocardia alni TaxID=33907 RepID=UPI0036888B59
MRFLLEGNRIPTALIGLTVIVAFILGAFFVDELPVIGSGPSYRAEFSEAAGLRDDDEVRVAGVSVGRVESIELAGDRVRVGFTADEAWVGDASSASIEIKDLLGQKYLSVEPAGSAALAPGATIPLERTRSPYDVTQALEGLSDTVGELDTAQLAEGMRVVADTFADSPEEVRGALDGLSRLSRTISSRDAEIASLLDGANTVSGVLADRDETFARLLSDGELLLAELSRRQEAIDSFLAGARRMSAQFTGLVEDNREQIGPALAELERITTILQRNRDNLALGIERLAPVIRVGANIIGNGRWFEAYFCNIAPPSVGPINSEGCTL